MLSRLTASEQRENNSYICSNLAAGEHREKVLRSEIRQLGMERDLQTRAAARAPASVSSRGTIEKKNNRERTNATN